MKVHFAALLFYTSLVSALTQPRVALHSAIAPSGSHWKRSARVPANETIRIDIALSLDGDSSEKAAQAIENISDPNSPSFGQHCSSKQVSELFAPPKEGIRELTKWLTNSGVPRSKLRLSPDYNP
jgi:subtilase family serine protease